MQRKISKGVAFITLRRLNITKILTRHRVRISERGHNSDLTTTGNYPAIVRGNKTTTGVPLVEVYNLDAN